jgi:hypothetical protein
MKIHGILVFFFFFTIFIIHGPASAEPTFSSQDYAGGGINNNCNGAIDERGGDSNPPTIVEEGRMPYLGEGIHDTINVSNKTAIRMRLLDETGVAMAEGTCHSVISAYAVYSNGGETLEPLVGQTSFKEVEAGNLTDVWATFVPDYAHTYASGLPQTLIVQVVVQACDVPGNSTPYFADGSYRFKIGAATLQSHQTIHDPNPGAAGDTCTATLDDGEIHGTRMEFPDTLEPHPYFGPTEEVPPLPDNAHGYGIPLNLQPPMIFTEGCLSLFIPIPEGNKTEQFSVWRFEPETGWKKAEAGDGWLESRIDHVSDRVGEPSTIELCINHFTGVQLAIDQNTDDEDDDDDNHFNISGSCFIATAAYGSPMAEEVVTLRRFRDAYLMRTSAGRAFVKLYYWISPAFAKVIARHQSLRAATILALTPIVWGCKLSLISPYAGLIIVAAWVAGISLVLSFVIRKREKQKESIQQ